MTRLVKRVRRSGRFASMAVFSMALAVAAGGCVLSHLRLPPIPPTRGRVIREAIQDQGRIEFRPKYLLFNNQWNKRAGPGYARIFVEEVDGEQIVGWQWDWRATNVAGYLEIVYGPSVFWPGSAGTEFPLQLGSRKVTVDFDVAIDAYGLYDLAFDYWILASPHAHRSNVTHEVMVLNVANGWILPGERLEKVEIDGRTFDLFVEKNWGDQSGGSPNKWTLVCFVSQDRILKASMNLSAFNDFLVKKGILSQDQYMSGVEFGTEMALTSGIVEVKKYEVRVE